MNSAALGYTFLAISLLGSALMALKLLKTGLYRRYPVFFCYFIFRVPNTVVPFLVDVHSPHYIQIWRVSFLLTLLFYALLVVELYRLVLENYRGLQTVGRWAMYISIVISATFSILTLLPKINPAVSASGKMIRIFLIAERGIDTALALFIILLLAVLSHYPIQLSRNVRVHAAIYSTFFLSNTLGVFIRSYFGLRLAEQANLVISVIGACSVFAWLVLLNPAGEKINARKMEAGQEKRLLTQLDVLNATMMRVSRQHVR